MPDRSRMLAAMLLLGARVAAAWASYGFVWVEGPGHYLSSDGTLPTDLDAGPGDNVIHGTINGYHPTDGSDFFRFTLGPNWELHTITLTEYSYAGDTTFLGIEDSDVYVTGLTNDQYFGYCYFGQEDLGLDLLDPMGASNGNFTPPLGAGTYTFWVNESGPWRVYELVFRIVIPGDLNCDGIVTFADINPFVLALSDPAQYELLYAGCPLENRDLSGDGGFDFGDINPFVERLTQQD